MVRSGERESEIAATERSRVSTIPPVVVVVICVVVVMM